MTAELLEEAPPGERRRAAPRMRPPLTRQRVVLRLTTVAFIAAAVWGWNYIEISFGGVVTGLGDVGNLLGRMVPPTFPDFGDVVRLTFETLWIAVIGTFMAVVLSVPLAFGAARNTTPHPAVMAACRAVIVASRAIPDLIFAAIFVRALGIGVLAGVLAIGLHSIGMVAKLFADAIEQTSPQPREAVTSTGATKWQTIVASVVPNAMPSFIATTLYRLDINLRSSTVLGLVGAGGIGLLLKQYQGALRYDDMLGVVVVIFVFITAMEVLSGAVRATLLGGERSLVGRSSPRLSLGHLIARRVRPGATSPAPSITVRVPFDRGTVRPPWSGERRTKAIYALVFAALVAISFWSTSIQPWELVGAIPDLIEVSTRLLPPDFTTERDGIVEGMLQSMAVALVATTLGAFLALPLGLLAARNVAANRVVYGIARLFLVALRGIPELIVVVIFIAAIGLGPVPGTFALVIGTAGFFAKLIADAVEEVDPVPREAVVATGATRMQETATSVIPPAMPALVGNLLYVLDINLRVSTVLGLVGGGGIGFLLFNSLRVQQWQTTGAILISIFAVVYLIELLAGWVRKQLL